ncbi:hypothetical protein RIVM261_059230 [Rivularia sp. IAM M-261]|nr:hypothetical protein RIVM261_059230 [Rivularia sp. IAM M-261]
MKQFIVYNDLNLSQSLDKSFRQYRFHVDNFLREIHKKSDSDTIIQATHKFINHQKNNYFEALIDTHFIEELDNLLSIFPNNRLDISRLKTLIRILLEQQIERYWYGDYSAYENDTDIQNDKELIDLKDSLKIKNRIWFTLTILNEDSFFKLFNYIHRKIRCLSNHPAKGTVGMRITKCKPAIIALLNEINQNINECIGQAKPTKLQINSILRTVVHQKHLSSLGYWAPATTSHARGYAADIEREWYFKEEPKLFQVIQEILHQYYEQSIINLIEEDQVWHVCLNPQCIEYYTQLFFKYI